MRHRMLMALLAIGSTAVAVVVTSQTKLDDRLPTVVVEGNHVAVKGGSGPYLVVAMPPEKGEKGPALRLLQISGVLVCLPGRPCEICQPGPGACVPPPDPLCAKPSGTFGCPLPTPIPKGPTIVGVFGRPGSK